MCRYGCSFRRGEQATIVRHFHERRCKTAREIYTKFTEAFCATHLLGASLARDHIERIRISCFELE
ncbi:hypothetical protein NY2A_b420L [Paramecium bursaria Chlorella virus NY2A]|uniref:Uncharacterized protein b420L n=1 Tax=Paramecium bursaria Chlorella virus NY2A TaxID=46021 RepID=A7IWU5_PBCVN|nr:hypothetical protein NY2A_b420L [Paramecium bursaria Chlorella virus NY2A]YP_001498449.1 hypothetical protein AR158_c368L [Paramecium bursaria Chlorella virus AR158]ABT14819.1 hypothetical protein NY2A_b420L [Paramecium bursaria Chlorella virus NY2A]ABU43913.1 hypothetical protein AR158_c368L [Paramecium bursaria Chlorella virus AR158]